jgi:hypothetical protein
MVKMSERGTRMTGVKGRDEDGDEREPGKFDC